MKTKFTLTSVIRAIQDSKNMVKSYMSSNYLPKYVGNAMLEQLDNAVTKVSENNLNEAYGYLLAYLDIRDQYANGYLSNYGEIPSKVSSNPYFKTELGVSHEITMMIALGLKPAADWKLNVYVRLLDDMRSFEVSVAYSDTGFDKYGQPKKKSTLPDPKGLADEIKDKAKTPTWEEFTS